MLPLCSYLDGSMAQFLVDRELREEDPRQEEGVRPGSRGKSGRGAVCCVRVNLAESPLTVSPLTGLQTRGHLTDRQFAPGEQQHADWERGEPVPSATMRRDPVRTAGGEQGLTAGEHQLAAKHRLDGAVAAAGPGLADILWRVVRAGDGVPAAEKPQASPARSGKLVLELALDRLAVFYGLSQAAPV
jgi:hypothetical protein